MKKSILLIVVLFSYYGCGSYSTGSKGEVNFIVTANVHGQLDPCG